MPLVNKHSVFVKRSIPAIAAVVLISASLYAAGAMFARAANSSQGSATNQGLTVSPFLMEREMQKGQTLNEIIEITNNSNRTLPVDISVQDFLPAGDNGQQKFLDPGQSDPHYSLSSWITIKNNPQQVLAPGGTTQVNFTITPPADAEDGGHYGAVLFSFTPAQAPGTAVQVSQRVGTIILVKLGKVKESGAIASFETEHSMYQYPPVTFVTRFHNDGNIHVKPRGGITITNMFGKEVGTALVNQAANNVLPQSDRVFQSTWNDSLAFGRYTAHEQLAYGDSGAIVEADTTFWVIPWKLVLTIALVLFVAILLLVYGVRRYNRWLINKVQNSRR